MQKSSNSSDWMESAADLIAINNLLSDSDPSEKRRLFPLSGRFLGSKSISYLAKGVLLRYVRTRMVPHQMPIQALMQQGGAGRDTRVVALFPEEIELLRPFEDS